METEKEKTKNAGDLYDAIVVGAGPAGASTALFLAKSSRRVLLLDKSSFPREKVCGDAFSGKSLGVARDLGLLPEIERMPHGIVRGLLMVAPNGKKVTVPFPNATGLEFAGYTVERRHIDNMFFAAALANKNITVHQNFNFTALIRDEQGRVCGVSGKDVISNKEQTFHSRVVVGADGAASLVSRLLSLPNSPIEHVYSAIRGYWSGVEGLSENIELYFIDGVLPGYLWIFPMEGKRANVGLGILSSDVIKGKKHPNTILLDAIAHHPLLATRFANAKIEGRIGAWAIPNGSYIKKNFGDGWVLVGDAASLVDPFSGEGVGNALSSGKFAAQAIDAAIGKFPGIEPLSADSLSPYSHEVDVKLRPEMVDSYNLQKLSRYRFLLNLFIGKAADKPEVRQMMVNMIGSDSEKKQANSPLFYFKLLLP
ncbi:MAG: NAD(P)/FAD-dependent oxidoreductase [Candidatus Micrarchaeota archaeon]|nr:NAD(P)/FAD-dependent oxidoreductase [Candidatus Micrarchaeota archaeon]